MDETNKNGISLRKLNMNMLIIAILISIVLFISMQRTQILYKESNEATNEMLLWSEKSYDLQLASDYLTDKIRSFAVTGEITYLNDYFTEINETKRRENALEYLSSQEEQAPVYEDLKEAMSESMQLMEVEYYSARLAANGFGIKDADLPKEIREIEIKKEDASLSKDELKDKAVSVLYDDGYFDLKNEISTHTGKCLSDIRAYMQERQNEVSVKLRKQVRGEHILIIVLILIMLSIVLLTARLIIKPLQKCVELIREEKEIPLKGAYEVQFLAKTYNLMYTTNHFNNENMPYESIHEPLTGLYNRAGFEHLMSNIDIETSALILLDLDNFSQVDHAFGKEIGDKVLQKTAQVILSNFRAQDYICKLENDDYAVVMIHTDSGQKDLLEHKIAAINERLRSREDNLPSISISAGVGFGTRGIDAVRLKKVTEEVLEEARKVSGGVKMMEVSA